RLAALRPRDFPQRPIEMTVAYPPGGGMDVHTRLLVKYLTAYSDQNFIVVNKAGASGLIGHTYIATQAKPDGHVVGVLSSNFWADGLQRADGKWTWRDIEPLSFFNSEPLGWVVLSSGLHRDRDLRQLLALAREKPGALRGAMSDGSPTAYLMGQVEKASGAQFTRVAYQGGKQALNDLAGGHIDVSYGYLGEYRALMLDGRVRPLAFSSDRRTAVLPYIPTFNEALGVDDIVWDAFRFTAAPRGLPADRRAWLVAVLQAAISDPNLA
ncbi:MAG: tripartite tricarboxylate transporter substrate binding protein, partial [Betaproteobacteria bacterium]